MRGSETPLSHSRFSDDPAPVESVYAVFSGTVNSPGQELSFWIEAGGEDALRRLVGCAILVAIPEEGMEEALTSLRDILDFHYERQYVLPPAGVTTQRRAGSIARTAKRPDLAISE